MLWCLDNEISLALNFFNRQIAVQSICLDTNFNWLCDRIITQITIELPVHCLLTYFFLRFRFIGLSENLYFSTNYYEDFLWHFANSKENVIGLEFSNLELWMHLLLLIFCTSIKANLGREGLDELPFTPWMSVIWIKILFVDIRLNPVNLCIVRNGYNRLDWIAIEWVSLELLLRYWA